MNSKPAVWLAVVWILIICIAANIVYSPSLRFFFSQDDFVFLERAARVTSLPDFVRLFTSEDHFYRPVPRVGLFVAQWHLFGPNAAAFHLVSLQLHTLNAVMLFLLCRRLFGKTILAGFSGFFYATHIVPFLAVFWVSGIQDLFMTTCLLLSLLLYLHYMGTDKGIWFSLSLLTYGLALLSKEMAATFPALVFLVSMAHRGQTGRGPILKRAIGRTLSYGCVLCLYLVIRWQKTAAFIPTEGPYALNFVPPIVLNRFLTYFGDALYARDWFSAAPLRATAVLFVLLAVLAFVLIRVRQYRWVIVLGMGWYTISLLPVLFISQPPYSFYAYFPLAGMAMVLATPVAVVSDSIRPPIASTGPVYRMAKGLGISLFLIAWLWFSTAQVQTAEAKDPAGIITKSILAQKTLSEVQALYPTLPKGSTLYVMGVTEREAWAVGHGNLFRLYYPGVEVILVPEEAEDQAPFTNNQDSYQFLMGGSE